MPHDEREEYVQIADVEVIRTTMAALLVSLPDGREAWIPISLLHPEDNEVEIAGDTGTLCLPRWLAEDRELL